MRSGGCGGARGSGDMAVRGGIDATHNAQIGGSRGLVASATSGEVAILLAGVASMPLTMRKCVVVKVWWLRRGPVKW